jgi:hypothetical protein
MAIYKDWFGNTYQVKHRNGYSTMRGARKSWLQLSSAIDYCEKLYLRKQEHLLLKEAYVLNHCMGLYAEFLSAVLDRMDALFSLYINFEVKPKNKESEMMKEWMLALLILYIKEYTDRTPFPDRETAETWAWRIELLKSESKDKEEEKIEEISIVRNEEEQLRQEVEDIEKGFRQMGYIVKFTGLTPGMREAEKRKLYDEHWDEAEYNPEAWTCRKGSKRHAKMLIRAENLKQIRKTQKEMLEVKFLILQRLLEVHTDDDPETRNKKEIQLNKLFYWFQNNELYKMFELEYRLDPDGQEMQTLEYNTFEWDEMKRMLNTILIEKRSLCDKIYYEERFSKLWEIIQDAEVLDHEDEHEINKLITNRINELNRQANIFRKGNKEYEQIVFHQNLRCYFGMDANTIKLLFSKEGTIVNC